MHGEAPSLTMTSRPQLPLDSLQAAVLSVKRNIWRCGAGEDRAGARLHQMFMDRKLLAIK